MNVGDRIVVTAAVFVVDALGHDCLIAGTEGTVSEVRDEMLTVRTAKGVYDSVPLSCVKTKTEENAA